MNKNPYDLQKVYDEEISPLMVKVLEICKNNDLPMAASFQYKSEGEDDYEFCNSAILPDKERPISAELEKIWNVLNQRRAKPFIIKKIDEQNKTVEITEIHS